MKCTVYRSNKKEFTYLYLPADRQDFSCVPDKLRELLGPLEQVLEFDLTPQRRLASENPEVVLDHLQQQGWYLQFPQEAYLTDLR